LSIMESSCDSSISSNTSTYPTDLTDTEKSILYQVEYYFGDFNLSYDAFTGKKLEEGGSWVELDLLAQYNKMQALNASAEVISGLLKRCPNHATLQLRQPDCSAIGRVLPLPDYEGSWIPQLKARTVHFTGDFNRNDWQNLEKYFRQYGPVEYVHMIYSRARGKEAGHCDGLLVLFGSADVALKLLDKRMIEFEHITMKATVRNDMITQLYPKHFFYADAKRRDGEPEQKCTITLPQAAVPSIIGRRGNTVKQIQDKTLTKIEFEDNTQSSTPRSHCVIRGPPWARKQAVEQIKKIIKEVLELNTDEVSDSENLIFEVKDNEDVERIRTFSGEVEGESQQSQSESQMKQEDGQQQTNSSSNKQHEARAGGPGSGMYSYTAGRQGQTHNSRKHNRKKKPSAVQAQTTHDVQALSQPMQALSTEDSRQSDVQTAQSQHASDVAATEQHNQTEHTHIDNRTKVEYASPANCDSDDDVVIESSDEDIIED